MTDRIRELVMATLKRQIGKQPGISLLADDVIRDLRSAGYLPDPERVIADALHSTHDRWTEPNMVKTIAAALRSVGYLLDPEPADAAWQWREWIHEQPDLSKCSVMADTCPDWPLAHRLAEQAARIRGGSSHD